MFLLGASAFLREAPFPLLYLLIDCSFGMAKPLLVVEYMSIEKYLRDFHHGTLGKFHLCPSDIADLQTLLPFLPRLGIEHQNVL